MEPLNATRLVRAHEQLARGGAGHSHMPSLSHASPQSSSCAWYTPMSLTFPHLLDVDLVCRPRVFSGVCCECECASRMVVYTRASCQDARHLVTSQSCDRVSEARRCFFLHAHIDMQSIHWTGEAGCCTHNHTRPKLPGPLPVTLSDHHQRAPGLSPTTSLVRHHPGHCATPVSRPDAQLC